MFGEYGPRCFIVCSVQEMAKAAKFKAITFEYTPKDAILYALGGKLCCDSYRFVGVFCWYLFVHLLTLYLTCQFWALPIQQQIKI